MQMAVLSPSTGINWMNVTDFRFQEERTKCPNMRRSWLLVFKKKKRKKYMLIVICLLARTGYPRHKIKEKKTHKYV